LKSLRLKKQVGKERFAPNQPYPGDQTSLLKIGREIVVGGEERLGGGIREKLGRIKARENATPR